MKKNIYFFIIAISVLVAANVFVGWQVYQKLVYGKVGGRIFAQADEDPTVTLQGKTDVAKKPVAITIAVVDAQGKPTDGVLGIAGTKVKISDGVGEVKIAPGAYGVSFTVDGATTEVSPKVVQITAAGKYHLIVK